MKKITSKVQRLSQRAAELRQAIESVPPKIAEVRQAVATATGHVQKLRADIVSSVATLRAETDVQLVETLREVDGSAELLTEAGCRLEGVDMDLGPTRRLIVHLERVEDVDRAHLRALLAANSQKTVATALLSAILKADELADNVELNELTFTRLTVDIGLIPAVKIGWRAATIEAASVVSKAEQAPEPEEKPRSDEGFGQSTFFQRRPSEAAPMREGPAAEAVRPEAVGPDRATSSVTAKLPSVDVPAVVSAAPEAPALSDDWRRGALDRFKKMPELGRRKG